MEQIEVLHVPRPYPRALDRAGYARLGRGHIPLPHFMELRGGGEALGALVAQIVTW